MGGDKKLAKLEKKRMKAEIKAMKKRAKESGSEKAAPAAQEPQIVREIIREPVPATREIIREPVKEKDWRSNVWLYIVVAIVVGLIMWGVSFILDRYFG